MKEIEDSKENEHLKDHKIEVKENNEDNKESNDKMLNNKKITEETLILSENKSKSLENNEIINNNKKSSTPLIEDNMYLNNTLKDDHYLLIERTKLFNIPYFTFGFTIHFYFPSTKLQTRMKLSEIPNPPFTIGPEGKYIYLYNNI